MTADSFLQPVADLLKAGQAAEAARRLEDFLLHQADDAAAWYLAGVARVQLSALDAAEQAFRRAITLGAGATAWGGLATVLLAGARLAEAEAACRQGLALDAEEYSLQYSLGIVLLRAQRPTAALEAFTAADRLAPCSDSVMNLGFAHLGRGDPGRALVCLREAVRRDPGSRPAWDNLLWMSHYADFPTADEIASLHRDWGRRMGPAGPPPAMRLEGEQRLVIGYVSPDLRRHSVAHFIEPLLRHHDRSRVAVTCFSDVTLADEVTARLRALCDRWIDLAGLDDAAAAERIRQEGIDVLVDLAGHTADNRLGVFAQRAAPVQASYLGYPDTTGLASVAVRLTDREADPEDGISDGRHVERLLRLPRCFVCYCPPPEAPPVAPPPCLGHGEVTFGSFNAAGKLSDATVRMWSAVLRAVPGSCLMLKAAGLDEEETAAALAERFGAQGIARERLQLLGACDGLAEHLAHYGRIDIALDTYPYHGTTTSCEALWMGVPVVTRAGDRHAARVGTSLLNALGHADWVAKDEADFVRIAVRLAADREGLANTRRALRPRMAGSPLCDGAGLARALEDALGDEFAAATVRQPCSPRPGEALHRWAQAEALTAQGDALAGMRERVVAARLDGERFLEPAFAAALGALATGDLAPGFTGYELRFAIRARQTGRFPETLPEPVWRGETPPPGSTLAVYAEQGYGDTLMFARFLPLVAERFARVMFHCPEALVRLMRCLAIPNLSVLGPEAPLQTEGLFHIRLGSLPAITGTTLATLPPPARMELNKPVAELWAQRLAPLPRPRIGLCWAGATLHGIGMARSIEPGQLRPLLEIPGIRWVSLQMGPANPPPGMHDPMAQVKDFLDTACIISQLDLVISVDTSVAHLAGMLGVPTWLLDRYESDWRWLASQGYVSWYPGLHVFRQSRPDVWADVIEQVAVRARAFRTG